MIHRTKHPLQFTTLFTLWVVVVLTSAAPAAAQTPDELAKNHYLAGKSYYQQGRYEEAIREFGEAFRLSPRPALLYNMAQAHEKLGRIQEAITHLKRALDDPKISNRQMIEEQLRNVERRAAATALLIDCPVDGAEVRLNGRRVGRTPLTSPVPVTPGNHSVRVTRPGYQPFTSHVSVTAGAQVTVTVRLGKKRRPASRAAPAPSAAASVGSPAPVRRRLWTWVLLGTSGALAVTAGVTGGLALSRADEAATSEGDDADAARTLALVSDITLGLAVGAAVGTVVLFFVEGRPEQPAKVTLSPLVGPGAVGLATQIRF